MHTGPSHEILGGVGGSIQCEIFIPHTHTHTYTHTHQQYRAEDESVLKASGTCALARSRSSHTGLFFPAPDLHGKRVRFKDGIFEKGGEKRKKGEPMAKLEGLMSR